MSNAENNKKLLMLLCESILVSRFARDFTDRITQIEKEMHINLKFDEPDIAQETSDIINHAEHTAFTL